MARPGFAEVRVDSLDQVQPLGRHLVLVFRAFEAELLTALQQRGYRDVKASDLDVLRFIAPAGSRAADIARLAGITKQGMAKALDDLARRGYVTRRPDKLDSRAKVVVFTRKGEALVGHAIEHIRAIEQRYARLLGAGRLRDMKQMLRTLFDDHRRGTAAS
jgi:DNA-binding MarR family transcriptional regulator